ncbi:hypothetical protein [Burkholderia ubonensis]|uniref:hypothetical protein n=1 Tax=Burkholderia ubonensis TaxID=101571 RepID=UPI000AE7839B|nr:hypothetical protein [Burkholderia ubonensis]
MYAELNVLLKSGVQPATISGPLATYFGNSQIAPSIALAGTPIAGYANLAVGAASFPSGAVVAYLCTANDEISVYVFGKTIPQLKEHCAKAVKQLKKMRGIKVAKASASVLVPINGTDTDILTGDERSWFSPFWDALLDKSISKLIAACVSSGLAVLIFTLTGTPAINGLIGLAATAIGVVFEAVHSAWRSESWSWKESQ